MILFRRVTRTIYWMAMNPDESRRCGCGVIWVRQVSASKFGGSDG